MAMRTNTLGSMLQGVSQQPDRARLPGQVSSQVNLISDYVRGLGTRPGTVDGPTLEGATHNMKYEHIIFKDETLLFGYSPGNLRVWRLDGTPVPMTGDMSYIGDDMIIRVVGDEIKIANRDTIVAMDPDTTHPPHYAAMMYSTGGLFSRGYSAHVTFGSGLTVSTEFGTPGGTEPGDGLQISGVAIMQRLVNQLLAHADWPATASILRNSAVAVVRDSTQSVTVLTKDSDTGDSLISINGRVEDTSLLPPIAPNGTVVEVGRNAGGVGNFWMRFRTYDERPVNGQAGFGLAGVWEEYFNPREPTKFDLTTMPRVIRWNGPETAMTISFGGWISRPVGDSVSAPFPSIVGSAIRDMVGFEGRLLLVARESVVMTRTNRSHDLWRESATQIVPTDPVDITSTKKDSLRLDWAIPYDRDMFLMSDPGDSQFLIKGGGVDPRTASMVLTTEYQINSDGARPTTTGRSILFPFQHGEHSGIKEFYTHRLGTGNAAESLTEAVPRYIPGMVQDIKVNQNFNLATFRSNSDPTSIYVYRFLWGGQELQQASWSRWEFKDTVLYWWFDNNLVYILVADVDGVSVQQLNLDRPVDQLYGWHVTRDRKRYDSLGDLREIRLPYADAVFLQARQCPAPGTPAIPTRVTRESSGMYRYEFNSEQFLFGSEMLCGKLVRWELKPTRPYGRDYQNNINPTQKITVQWYSLSVDNSGPVKAIGSSPYMPDWEFYDPMIPLDGEPLDPRGELLRTGELIIPWGHRADYASITFTGDDPRPVNILELEWTGQVIKSPLGRRT